MKKDGASFWRYLVGPRLVVVLAISVIASGAHHAHLLSAWDSTAIDAFVLSRGAPKMRHVVLVTITNEDYHSPDLFDGVSPLNPGIVADLVRAILAGDPSVVGVDLDTSHEDYGRHPDLRNTKVVWARDAWRDDKGHWNLLKVLGGGESAASGNHAEVPTGVSLFPRDSDGMVRSYYRELALDTASGGIHCPSLPWAILEVRNKHRAPEPCRPAGETANHESPIWFNFAADQFTFRKIPAGVVYRSWKDHRAPPSDDFRGVVVLLGGSFQSARDTHLTPLGEIGGAELTALAVESEITGGGIHASNHVLMFVCDVLSGIALVFLHWKAHRVPPARGRRVLLSTGGIALVVLLAFLGSYVSFRAFGYWASFLPVALGVWLHQAYDRAKLLRAYQRRYPDPDFGHEQ